jgi:hypothetical protein
MRMRWLRCGLRLLCSGGVVLSSPPPPSVIFVRQYLRGCRGRERRGWGGGVLQRFIQLVPSRISLARRCGAAASICVGSSAVVGWIFMYIDHFIGLAQGSLPLLKQVTARALWRYGRPHAMRSQQSVESNLAEHLEPVR